jgi:hypothetical protein
MRVRWNIYEADLLLAKDMASEELSATIKVPLASLPLRVLIWTSCAAALLALTEAYRFGPGYGSTTVLVAAGVTAIAAYVALQRFLLKAAKRAQLQASGPFPIPYELEVCEAGLRASGQDAETHIGWRAIGPVAQLPQYVSIALRWGGILLVPNDAFDTNERRKEFVDTVHEGVTRATPAAEQAPVITS